MKTRPLLWTGFEPFGGDSVNPSWLAAPSLQGEGTVGACVQALCLPCVFGQALQALQALQAALHQQRPQMVMALGLDTQLRAAQLALQTRLQTGADLRQSGGTIA